MNRVIATLCVLGIAAFAAKAPAAPPSRPKTSVGARALARQAESEIRAADSCIKSRSQRAGEAEGREQRAQKRVNDLRAEKERVLADLRAGRFCNKCWRSASEIEKGGQSFAQHLTDVKGEPKPAPADKVARRAADFDQRIASADRERSRAANERTKAQGEERACIAKRDQGHVHKKYFLDAARRLAALEKKQALERERQRYLARRKAAADAKRRAEIERRKSKDEKALDRVLAAARAVPKAATQPIARAVVYQADRLAETAPKLAEKVLDKHQQLGEKAAGAARDAVRRADDAVHKIGDQIAAKAEKIGGKAAAAAQNLANDAARAGQGTGASIAAAGQKAGGAVAGAGSDLGNTIAATGKALGAPATGKQLGDRVTEASKNAGDGIAATAREFGDKAKGLGQRVGEGITNAGHRVSENVTAAGHALKEKTREIWQGAKDLTKGGIVAANAKVAEEIKALKKDDKFTMSVAGDIGVGAAKVSGKGEVVVTKKGDENYEVKGSVTVGLDATAKLGSKSFSAAKAEASAEAGGKLQMSAYFQAKDAKDATDTAKTLAKAPLGQTTAQERRDLAEKVTALEAKGTSAAKIAGVLKFGAQPGEGEKVAPASGSGSGVKAGIDASLSGERTIGSVRFDFPKEKDKGPTLTISQEYGGKIKGSIEASAEAGKFGKAGVGGNAEASLTATVKTTLQLPKSIDKVALQEDPLGTLGKVGGQVVRDSKVEVTLKGEASWGHTLKSNPGGAAKAEGSEKHGGSFTLSAEVKPQMLDNAMGHFSSGNLKTGLDALGKDVPVKASFKMPDTSGASAGVGPAKVSQTTERSVEVSISGNASAVAGALERIRSGDVRGGLQLLPKDAKVELKREAVETTGFSAKPELKIMGVGAGMELKAEREARSQAGPGFSGNAEDALRWFDENPGGREVQRMRP